MTALQYSWYIGLHRIIDSERFLYGNRDCSQNTSSRRYYVEPRPHCHQYLCVMQYTQHCLSAQRRMATGKGVLLRGWYSEFFSRNLEARISVSYHSGPIRLSDVSVFIPATPFKDGSSYLTRCVLYSAAVSIVFNANVVGCYNFDQNGQLCLFKIDCGDIWWCMLQL